jgi:hypothetical protein
MRESESMGMYIPIDLWETDHEYIVKAFIPGARSEDIHIQVHGDTLRISGETKEETPEQGKPGRWLIREHRAGHFQRTITIPQPVQADPHGHYGPGSPASRPINGRPDINGWSNVAEQPGASHSGWAAE